MVLSIIPENLKKIGEIKFEKIHFKYVALYEEIRKFYEEIL